MTAIFVFVFNLMTVPFVKVRIETVIFPPFLSRIDTTYYDSGYGHVIEIDRGTVYNFIREARS